MSTLSRRIAGAEPHIKRKAMIAVPAIETGGLAAATRALAFFPGRPKPWHHVARWPDSIGSERRSRGTSPAGGLSHRQVAQVEAQRRRSVLLSYDACIVVRVNSMTLPVFIGTASPHLRR